MNWIKHPTLLSSQRVQLIPLEKNHFDELCILAREKSIWKYSPMDVDGSNSDNLRKSLIDKLEKREKGEYYPFVIQLKENSKIIV